MDVRQLIQQRTFRAGEMTKLLKKTITENVTTALAEDRTDCDVSAQLIHSDQMGEAQIVARQSAVIAGCWWATECFARVNSFIKVDWHKQDGDAIEDGQALCRLHGPIGAIVSAERCALNFLQTLSATATHTQAMARAMAQAVSGTTLLLDTRKTLPGLRIAQKYATACGGAYNHRLDLGEMVLIKENHIAACGSIAEAVAKAREVVPELLVEVETENLAEVKLACEAKPDLIMLDNFSLGDIAQAVQAVAGRYPIEVSGGVTMQNIAQIAELRVDFIAVGDLTKNIQAVDLSLQLS